MGSVKYTDQDLDIMVKTIWGEARGEGQLGQQAVAWVILNRLAKPGWWSREKNDGIPDDTIAAVCRDPWQFSCWLKGDPNLPKMEALDARSMDYIRIRRMCKLVLEGRIPDPTDGATHYVEQSFVARTGWTRKATKIKQIGNHVFYKDVK